MKCVRVFLIDESPFFLRWFRSLISALPSVRIIGEARDPISAIRFLQRLSPDAVIMDMKTQLRFGIDLVRSIRKISPVPKIIVLTSDIFDEYRGMAFGKTDFLLDKCTEYRRIPEILQWVASHPLTEFTLPGTPAY